jgi:hypothetical protein
MMEVLASAVLALLTAALVVTPAAVEPLLPMAALDRSCARMVAGRDALQVYGVRRKKTAVKWGKLLLLSSYLFFTQRSFCRMMRNGSGGVNLAVHMSAPWELWPPLRTVIEEAR